MYSDCVLPYRIDIVTIDTSKASNNIKAQAKNYVFDSVVRVCDRQTNEIALDE